MNESYEFKGTTPGMEKACAAGSPGCAAVVAERRRASVAEVMYGIAAMTVAIFLLATSL